LVQRSAQLGLALLRPLHSEISNSDFQIAVRGAGLLAGLEVCRPDGSPATTAVFNVIKLMLRRGFILLPEGEHANVISFTPPLTISERQLAIAVTALQETLKRG